MYYNTEVRRNNEPIFLFVFLYRYYYIIFTGTYQYTYVYIILQKIKSLCFTTEQGNYTFLAAN